ncbi:phosphate acyltransferase PlsX [Aliagarivorans marinus]|uniref:phosphate acyltransferase PlsX n=1 Tax=Aliagarivorans marinus TaxID=561965 RepID=UPI000414F4C0|nr:phosphate acyltransferase PlsX [Aliagarivorans marinus]
MQKLTIAVDAMGGDFGPSATVPAIKQALAFHPHLNILLFGEHHALNPELIKHQIAKHPRLEFIHCADSVRSDDRPITALRARKDSSMRQALEVVKQGRAQACVSAGNTGALMALAKSVLKLLPGIERPALVTGLPLEGGGETLLLDLGANSSCDSEILSQFAMMGAALAEACGKVQNPRVALLNIGEEQIKGNDVVRQTAQLLESSSGLNYVGFVEGNQLFANKADVIVCDGFVGNVALKTAEGVAQLLLSRVSQSTGSWWQRLLLKVFAPQLAGWLSNLNPDQYNGASLLGLRGIVVKSHGHADHQAFFQAINQSVIEVQQQVPQKIIDKIEALLTDKN